MVLITSKAMPKHLIHFRYSERWFPQIHTLRSFVCRCFRTGFLKSHMSVYVHPCWESGTQMYYSQAIHDFIESRASGGFRGKYQREKTSLVHKWPGYHISLQFHSLGISSQYSWLLTHFVDIGVHLNSIHHQYSGQDMLFYHEFGCYEHKLSSKR